MDLSGPRTTCQRIWCVDLGDAAGVDAHGDVVAGLMGLLPGLGATGGEQSDDGDGHGEGSSEDHVG